MVWRWILLSLAAFLLPSGPASKRRRSLSLHRRLSRDFRFDGRRL